MKKLKIFYICLAVVICIASVILFPHIKNQSKVANQSFKVDNANEFINTDLKDAVEKKYKEEQDIKEISAEFSSEIRPGKRKNFEWLINEHVSIKVDNSFDNLSDWDRLAKLKQLFGDFMVTVNKEIADKHPVYEEAFNGKGIDYTDERYSTSFLSIIHKTVFHVKTDSNLYRYGDSWDAGYNLNGKDIHVLDKVESEDKDYKPIESLPDNTSNKKKKESGSDAYDEGYDDIYFNEDYDADRYHEDPDYANGVDNAMDDAEDDFGDEW